MARYRYLVIVISSYGMFFDTEKIPNANKVYNNRISEIKTYIGTSAIPSSSVSSGGALALLSRIAARKLAFPR